MSDPTINFAKEVEPIEDNPKAGIDTPDNRDEYEVDGRKLPDWAKGVIITNIVMIHVVVFLVGIDDVPFTLNDAALAAYVVVGLGTPVGLASQAIRAALSSLFATGKT